MKGFNKLLQKLHTPKWLFILLLVVFILRIPSFFEPYSYGDEMIYLTLGEAIRQGIPLYKGVHDNKPPLLYIMAAVSGSLFWFKAMLAIWHLVTVFIFWKLTQRLFEKSLKAQKLSTAIFAILTTIPLLEGNIVNAELFLIGPTILAFLILLSKNITPKILIISGTLFSISTLFKVPAAFDIPVIVFLWFVSLKRINQKNIGVIVKNALYLAIGFASPIVLTLVWYFLSGAFREYLVAAFLQNVGYLSSWRPEEAREPFLIRNLPLFQRATILTLGLLILYKVRLRLSREFVFATSWLLFSLFAVTLSERPYPHYLIQSVPAISLLLTFLFTKKTSEQTLAIIPLTLAVFVPVYFNFWYYPTFPYYLRFIKLATKQMTREEYLTTFGYQVPRNYKIADFVIGVTEKGEKIFVWGDSPPIYALTRRFPPTKYVAQYHIQDFSSNAEILYATSLSPPTLFIILPDAPSLPDELEMFLQKNYALFETVDSAQIWKLLGPRVRAILSS